MVDSLLALRILVATIAFPFGLIVGSFANVVIYRLPHDQSVVFPASRCPRCGRGLRFWHNIPVLSWAFLRGKCAFCGNPISPRYPLIELFHGVGFAMVCLRFGLLPFTYPLLAFFSALVILAFIDWDHQILPDAITLPGILIGIASTRLVGALVEWKESVLTALIGYLSFLLVAKGYERLRGVEGLGQGDWKLAAMMGAFLGAQGLLLTVFLGSLSGMTYGLIQAYRLRRAHGALGTGEVVHAEADDPPHIEVQEGLNDETPEPTEDAASDVAPAIGKYKLPFGTFLAGSAIITLFRGEELLTWYGSFFRP